MIKTKFLSTLSKFQIVLLLFFVFGSLFPTFRILLIGSQTSKNVLEYFISGLFDLSAIVIIAYSFIHIYKKIVYRDCKTENNISPLVMSFTTIPPYNIEITSMKFPINEMLKSLFCLPIISGT